MTRNHRRILIAALVGVVLFASLELVNALGATDQWWLHALAVGCGAFFLGLAGIWWVRGPRR